MKLHISYTAGKRIPLVFLHGWGFHSDIWDKLAARLQREDYKIYCADLPGHGRSAMPKNHSHYSLERISAALVEQVPEAAIWLGWSLGGLVASSVALRYPDRVRALALIATTPRFTRAADWTHGLIPENLQSIARRLQSDYCASVREFIDLQLAKDPALSAKAHIAALGQKLCELPPHPQALAAGAGLLAQSDLRRESVQISCPTMLIHGDRDALVPAGIARDWRNLWPALQTVPITGAAHMPFISHPEPFFQALQQLLQQVPSDQPSVNKEQPTMTTQTAVKNKSRASAKHKTDSSTGAKSNLQIDKKTLEQLYGTMRRIRAFDEKVAELFNAGEIKGTAHSYVGQEAVAAGICAHLLETDFIASHHRGHGHCIAKGASMARMMAELMGRDTGYCRGLGGSMHIADMELNILGANGIVGASMPLSSGAALATKIRGTSQVVVAFFGDGASNQGVFHEAMNLASVWKLPLVFVCENNQYALTTSYRNTTSVEQVSQRAAAYSVPGVTVDGNDVAEMYLVTREAIERARAGLGPTLIEAMTYRWGQHSMRANLRDPRPGEEYDAWMAKDPLKRVETQLDAKTIKRIAAAVEKELASAVDFARQGPEPLADLFKTAVYAPHPNFPPAPEPGTRELSFQQALNEALHQEMARDDSVFLMGEDVGATGGIFTVSKGLFERFGEARVRDTPISEAGFVGCGVGAAIAGMRPVVEIQIFDFIALTMDMLVNQAAKFRFMLGGKNTVPLVVRGPQGGGIRLAAQHSQSLEAWFTHVPGLVVVAPSTPYDAKGLLVAAIRDDNPVIFLEAKLLYMGSQGPVPEALYALPIGKADVKCEGDDVTVVATMAMVPRALAAAEQLSREGIDVEVIDPRTLRPLDEETILASVHKTGRLVIVHEAWVSGGFGAEVAAIAADKAFMALDAPIRRVGALDVPMPYHDGLEREVIPSTERLMAKSALLPNFEEAIIMPNRFQDRVIIVTGAGSIAPGWGNGKAAAVSYAREGGIVFCVDIHQQAAEETRAIIAGEGGSASAYVCDVSKSQEVEAMVSACLAAYSRIDVLHNNVGIVENGTIVEASEESWDRVHDINLKSVFLTCKYVLPQMEKQGKGVIINISSTAGIRDMGVSYCSYSATKAAIIHLTRTMALDYAGKGIRANTVIPGIIHTPLVEKLYTSFGEGQRERLLQKRNEQIPLGRMGEAWDIAQAALFLASDDAKYITGTELLVDGGLTVKCI